MPEETIDEQIPNATDAEAAMRQLITPPVEEETPPPQGDTPPAASETPPEPEKPTGEEAAPPPVQNEEPDSGTPTEDSFDAEIDKIEPLPTASKATKEAVKLLKEKSKAEHRRALEADKRAKELEAAQAQVNDRIKELESKVLTPEIEKELTELRQFRDTWGLENDPVLNKQYDDRINSAQEGATNVLKAIGVPEATLQYIQNNGGLYNFRMSNDLMPPNVKNTDGSRMTQSQFYKRFIDGNLSEAQKEELQDSFSEIRRASREKTKAIENIKTNREQFVAQRNEQITKAKEDWVNRVTQHSEVVLKTYGDMASKKEIPPNASPEQKAAIEQHNANYDKAEAKARQILSNVTPENLVEAAIAAGYVEVIRDHNSQLVKQNSALSSQVAELQKSLDDLKKAGVTASMRTEPGGQIPAKAKQAKTAEDAMAALVNANQE